MWLCIVTNFFVTKPTRCTNFTDLFCHETLHISDLYDIPLLSVQWINSWWWTDELSEICRVSWQNKSAKFVHLVGFITEIFRLSLRFKVLSVVENPCSQPFGIVSCPCRLYMSFDWNVSCSRRQGIHVQRIIKPFSLWIKEKD